MEVPRPGWRRWFVAESHLFRLPNGSAVTMIPKPAGYPVVEPHWRMALPPSIDLLYDLGRYLRYLLGRRRAWTIYVLQGDLSNGGIRDAEVLRTLSATGRTHARERIQEVGWQLEARGLDGLPSSE